MPGVHIGNGAVIGANFVAAKDVLPYTIVAGNPIKEIRKRFSDHEINILLEIEWWNWDIDKITRNLEIILGNDVSELLEVKDEIS